jgi:nucleolar protein 53
MVIRTLIDPEILEFDEETIVSTRTLIIIVPPNPSSLTLKSNPNRNVLRAQDRRWIGVSQPFHTLRSYKYFAMGKRLRGAALRAQKRAKLAVEELQEQQAEQVVSRPVASKTNEELFVLDKVGDKTVPKAKARIVVKDDIMNPIAPKALSEKDQLLVNRVLSKNSVEKLQEWAQSSNNLTTAKPNQSVTAAVPPPLRTRGMRSTTRTNFDLWTGAPETAETIVTTTTALDLTSVAGIKPPSHCVVKIHEKRQLDKLQKRKVSVPSPTLAPAILKRKLRAQAPVVAVPVATAGQSYHPDPVAHDRILETAVQVELQRQAALEYEQAPISQGLSVTTKKLLVDDSDDEDDEKTTADTPVATPVPRTTEKLTRAQRNKQKRLRRQRALEDRERTTKKLWKSVGEIPRYQKEFKSQQKHREQVKQAVSQQIQEQYSQPVGINLELQVSAKNPAHAPSIPVALPSELGRVGTLDAAAVWSGTSLRTVKPKGNLLVDRMVSLRSRNIVPHPTVMDRKQSRNHGRKKKLRVTGTKNNVGVTPDFVVMG